ncbi:MAG TPA: Nramp family divalent metal transporter, partial [Candidatus Paceibacterota bacterium]
LITGAADDDPSGIATYSQTGAATGFGLLWLSLFSFPFMAVVQEMCARIGIATGKGLAANMRALFPAWTLYASAFFFFAANVFNIGADLGAMAKATQLVFPVLDFSTLVISFVVISLLLQIFTTYARYAQYLKYLTFALFAYVATALVLNIDWSEALWHTAVPQMSFSKDTLLLVCAILGTTISPYLFFWQTSQEIEEAELRKHHTVRHGRSHESKHVRIRAMRIDTWTGMFISNAIMFFIISVSAAVFATHGITNIQTADQAALALEPFAGRWATLLFAIGIIGTGMLAVPILAGSASYAVSDIFGWETGLYKKLHEAYAFYGVIIIAMLIGLIINFSGFDPIRALFWSAVGNGVVAPLLIVFIVLIASNKKIMGEHANGPASTILGWLTVAIMAAVGLAALL